MKLTEKLLLISEFELALENGEDSLDLLFHNLVDTSKRITNSDRGSFFLYDPKTELLQTQIAEGMPTKITVEIGTGLVGKCALTKEIVVEDDVDTTKNFNSDIDMGSGYVTRNTLTIPVLDGEENILGVIQVLNKVSGNYDEQDEELLLSLANVASTHICLIH
ncbi:MAG: GAF domain-containing protein [Thiovulaceae bacterium]|nr:GAF domain-containing protein [Sulfurimonadaceae bacterium]